ncbi:hypothetical protein TSUD_277470 [Trifolium subterraneum]|uniref:Uncharacterized protein n=1 Tax=Trifolium subterraneum TaxID=3900 RepID=A0A2Z6MYK0_TRISU|nr:hypothetical protein TSUD_277470 [Trifolium subterraneum]
MERSCQGARHTGFSWCYSIFHVSVTYQQVLSSRAGPVLFPDLDNWRDFPHLQSQTIKTTCSLEFSLWIMFSIQFMDMDVYGYCFLFSLWIMFSIQFMDMDVYG